MSPDSHTLPSTATSRFRNFNPIPFRGSRVARYLTGFTCLLGSTNPLHVTFTWNLSPLRPSKFSFEYLLLPPRSAPTAAPPRLAPEVSRQPLLLPGSRPRFCGSRRALLLIEAWLLPRRPGMGRALKRHPFSGLVDSSFAPIPKSDERFARQYRCGPPPEFPRLRPCFGHSSPSFGSAQAGRMGSPLAAPRARGATRARASVKGAPPSSVRERRRIRWRVIRPGLGSPRDPRRSTPRVEWRTGSRRPVYDRGASPAPIRFPPENFKHSLTLFSKVRAQRGCHPLWCPIPWDLRPVRRRGRFCRLQFERRKPLDSHSGLFPVCSQLLGESLYVSSPPLIDMLKLSGCSHLTWGRNPSKASGHGGDCRQGSSSEPGPRTRLRATQGQGEGSHHSSCQSALGAKCFSGNLAREGKDDQSARPRRPAAPPAVGQEGTGWGENTSGVTPMQVRRRATPRGTATRFLFHLAQIAPSGCSCVRVPDRRGSLTLSPSAGREREARGLDGRFAPGRALIAAGHRVQLVRLGRARFVESTMILQQVQWTSHNVIGGEPPTSPRSEHFTGPFNRQIAPPTKNGHAPPPIESRKSSQSVNPYYVWTCTGGTTRPVKARSASPVEGTSRPVHTAMRTDRPNPRSNYELFNCNNLNIRYWSWNYRDYWHRTCPPMDPR
ncbi:hypothetical protein H6P81_016032 [Aristolochia fimbriata]|uniref:Uncharacterized protein n=1 Tax=Aristolochia fimbriata TaxID=158543 RepID=A0AAV7EAC7_ARIFI|nr:hypothetical protein H6P81_016032 [Aristolochia fimbriata]